jgi:hypothetical protein
MTDSDRLPNETDRQYLAFKIYRNLGASRSVLGAQRAYDKVMGKDKDGEKKSRSGSFHKWHKENRWDERVRPFDAAIDAAEKERMVLAGAEEYCQRVEKMRSLMEDSGLMGLENAAAILKTCFDQLTLLIAHIGSENVISDDQLTLLTAITRINKLALTAVAAGFPVLYDAMGLRGIIDAIKGENED